ncbi:unnamed protein product [Orchesella dallaii]|uniref:Uncharacterized protein n=1 Tax=Orchesella dallaii TaxID=48710 RepID=A0ABP1S399_9HEXA
MKLLAGIVVSVFLLASLGGTEGYKNLGWLRHIYELALSPELESVPILKVDEITFNLVDTSLALLQIGKYANFLGYQGAHPLLDWVYDFKRVNCKDSCVQQDVHVEFREPGILGAHDINITTDVSPTRFNFTLNIPNVNLTSLQYHHSITNNVTGETKIGESPAYLKIVDAAYGIAADYRLVPAVGIQLSNLSLTLNVDKITWTCERRYTLLPNGFIIDDGLLETNLSRDLMELWNGDFEGQPLKPQYEQWAQYVLNCGLSGGRSDAGCADIEGLRHLKLSDFAAALKPLK